MGLQDREYYRDDSSPPGLHFSVQTVWAKLIIANVVLFIANMMTSGWLFDGAMAGADVATWWQRFDGIQASARSVTDVRYLWQLLTYGFAHASPTHILFNMFALWMFGRDVEERRGPSEFLVTYLLALVLGSTVWCMRQWLQGDLNHVLQGASGAVSAVVMLFILADPKRKLLLFFVYPVPAWVIGGLMIAINILGMQVGEGVAYDVHLVGIAFAVAYFYSGIRFTQFFPGWIAGTAQRFKQQPALRVHDPEAYYADLDEEADRILDKVHRQGEASLNRRERKILKDYSRRMRQKHQ